MNKLSKTCLNINNVFLTIFCFFPVITALFKPAIYFYFSIAMCWGIILICRDSFKKTIMDFFTYVFSNPFFFFLGLFAAYIIFNFYFLSPYKAPTFGFQFLPFHVTSAFGVFLLYIANKEHFNKNMPIYALSATFILYIAFCCLFGYQNFHEVGDIIRNMLPFLLVLISCLLITAIYKHFHQSPNKIFSLCGSIIFINFVVAFVSDGNTTKLILGLSIIITLLSYFFRKMLSTIMTVAFIFSVISPIFVANIKDFSLLDSTTFALQVRSVQTRLPQWMLVLDKFFESPITGYGVYASYYVSKKEFIKQEFAFLNNIVENTTYQDKTKGSKAEEARRDELTQELIKIFKNSFLVERTNQYYNLKLHISEPDYGNKFIEGIKHQLKYIDQILEILQELNKLELNKIWIARIDDQIAVFDLEKLEITKFLQAYDANKTHHSKQHVLEKELARFLDYTQFKINTHPHNLFLQILFELGAVGLVLLLLPLFFILHKISKIADLFYKTISYIIFFIFVVIYSTTSSIWYMDIHQLIYIATFLFFVIWQDHDSAIQNHSATNEASDNPLK